MKFPFIKGKKVVTILEIDDNWLKLVQTDILQRQRKVTRVVVKNINNMSEDDLGKMVKDLCKEFKVDTNHFIVSVPSNFASIRNPEFPSIDPTEIKDMIELQIGKQTPYSINEIVSDYQISYASPDGYSRLMLVIVHRDIIDRYSRIIEKSGLKLERITLSSEGALNWCTLTHADSKLKDTAFLLIDVDYSVSNLIVILNNKIIFNRSISLGVFQSAQDIDKWQKDFIEEVNRSIYAYNNEVVNKDIGKIVIGGSERITAKFNDNLLKDSFNLPVEILGQFKNIAATGETLDLYGGDIKDTSISSLIGLGLKHEKQSINLIPQEIKIERAMKKRGRELYVMGILMAFILIFTSIIFLEKIYTKEHYLDQLKTEMSSIGEKANELEVMKQRLQLIDSRTNADGSVLNAIYEIYKIISPEIHLLSLSFDGKYNVGLRGSSNEMSEVFKFVNELEKSECFENVKTKYVSKNKVEGQEVADFEIICPLNRSVQRALRNY